MKALRRTMRKVRRGEGGFTLIELLIVIIILGVLAAVVAFNVGGFLGQGTEETAKTELAAVQTAILAAMADGSVSTVTQGSLIADTTENFTLATVAGEDFTIETYLQLPTHGNWTWDDSGMVTDGDYSGGGKTCTYDEDASPQWSCA